MSVEMLCAATRRAEKRCTTFLRVSTQKLSELWLWASRVELWRGATFRLGSLGPPWWMAVSCRRWCTGVRGGPVSGHMPAPREEGPLLSAEKATSRAAHTMPGAAGGDATACWAATEGRA